MSFIAFRGTIELLQSAPVLIMARPAHGSFKAGPLLRLQQMDQIVQIEVKSTIRYRRDVVRVSQCIELSISPVFSLLKPHSQSGTAQRIVKRWSMHRKDNTHLVDASVVDEVILPSNLAV